MTAKTTNVDVVVVGAGLAGLAWAKNALEANPALTLAVLEAENRVGGRATGGLHVLDSESAANPFLEVSEDYAPALVRWDRAWVNADQVNWEDKDWMASVPQWKHYVQGAKKVLRGVQWPDVAVQTQCPANALARLEDTSGVLWRVVTPERDFIAKKVVWAAGIKALQNALGKDAAQRYLTANPLYDMKAADFRGGVAWTLEFSQRPEFENGMQPGALWAIPVRHEGKLYLLLAAFIEKDGRLSLQTLTHVTEELLSDPKAIMSFQKSLRRGVKAVIMNDAAFTEKWVVHAKVGAHVLGSMWLLQGGDADGLVFIGDESLAAQSSGHVSTTAALDSVSQGARQ